MLRAGGGSETPCKKSLKCCTVPYKLFPSGWFIFRDQGPCARLVGPGEPVAIRVVLAEDSELLLRKLRQLLTDDDRVELVGMATSVPDALNVLRESSPDVLVFDLSMAVRHRDRCDDLRHASAKHILVAITFSIDEEGRSIAARCGAACVVDKMKLHEELISEILRCADGNAQSAK